MIEIQNLSRCRAGQQVLRDVTLRIRNGTEAGNFCALIGSAGAGKTTLLEMMAGCIRPDEGTVQISGYDIVRQPREAKKQIGYLPQGMKPPADMTVWEYLDFVAGAKRLRGENAVRQIAAVCRQTAITDVQDKRIGALPDIVCRRVALAQTLLGKPEFLLLDDPAEGLDAAQSAGLYRLIREIGAGRTVVAAGRPTSGLHTYCDRIILLDRGRVTAEKDAAALRRDAAPAGLVLHLTAKGDPEGVAENDPDTRHNMRWTPLQGCDDPAVAMRRAQTMVAIGGMGSGSNNQEWGVSAAMYVQAMLYAAAIADRTINDCYRWSLSPEAAQEAADLIRKYTPEREMDRWAATLNALPHVDPRQKGSEWFGVKNAFSILADPNVRARMNLSPSDPRLIDPKRMVLRVDTVYVLSKPRRDGGVAGNAGIFVSLLLDTFQEACQDLAFDKASGSRGKIEPPARFVLDELSNIEKWPGLRNAITQGGGNGYQLIIVEQSRQQMADEKDGYGKAVEQTVWENCHRIMLKGVSDDETLKWWISQIGTHHHTRRESSWNPGQGPLGGLTTRHEREESVTQQELSLLPVGYALVEPLGQAPALVHMIMFHDRDWWREGLEDLRPSAGQAWHETEGATA